MCRVPLALHIDEVVEVEILIDAFKLGCRRLADVTGTCLVIQHVDEFAEWDHARVVLPFVEPGCADDGHIESRVQDDVVESSRRYAGVQALQANHLLRFPSTITGPASGFSSWPRIALPLTRGIGSKPSKAGSDTIDLYVVNIAPLD